MIFTMLLGEASGSFAYSGCAKKGRDSKFEDYGESFKKVSIKLINVSEIWIFIIITPNVLNDLIYMYIF